MSMQKATLAEINRVAAEVLVLTGTVAGEIDGQSRLALDEATGYHRNVPKYPNGNAPGSAAPTYPGTMATAALRRRSMDLTRLLAEMRRAQ